MPHPVGEAGEKTSPQHPKLYLTLEVETRQGRWAHDNEDEFFADYRRSTGFALFRRSAGDYSIQLIIPSDSTSVSVEAPQRGHIESVFAVFDAAREGCRLPEEPLPPEPEPPKPVVFIGHGHDQAWRDLKDHLSEKQGYEVEAYEVGARAGHAVRDILQGMLKRSSIAFLVMTGEDITGEGNVRPRQNVVHEAGLFQGRLGFSRAIVVVEEGVELFSNIDGIEQIGFKKGNIREAFGEVVATIRREFGT